MSNFHDVLSGFSAGYGNPEPPSEDDVLSLRDEVREELKKVKKKLKRAKKKGKGCKKLKKKFKKLKKKNAQLEMLLVFYKKQPPSKGRWDGLIESALLEAMRLAASMINRKK